MLKIILEMHLIRDRSYNFEETWKFLERAYDFNNGIYSSINKFSTLNTAFLKLIKYSATSLIPYDFSKVNEILEMQEKQINKEYKTNK